MKRSLDVLLRDERERQEEDLLRAQLQRQEATEAALKKQQEKEETYVSKWRSHLSKWDEMENFAEHTLTLPAPDPPGPSNLLFWFLLISLRCNIRSG